ncbi:hypothetical protein [uncultured Methanolobus sp.]|uniref:hypothetical protein n=1 Tax=uncultured Methanolobus sp. TaxID=218300 RepID=UPI002AAB9249|nr:hypothetical protein [uncultured Methanolobus sp.]
MSESAFLLAVAFFIDVIGMCFMAIDSWVLYEGYSVLDFFVAVDLVSITLWGIFTLIDDNSKKSNGDD